MNPDVWVQFFQQQTDDLPGYYSAWLNTQCQAITDVRNGFVFAAISDGFESVACWPAGSDDAVITDLVAKVADEKCGLVTEVDAQQGSLFAIAYPVMKDEEVEAIAVLTIATSSETEVRNAMGELHWGIAWLELSLRKDTDQDNASARMRLQGSVELFASVLSEKNYESAAMELVSGLADRYACERVSLGYVKNGRSQVQVLSHSAEFGKKMNLMRCIASAMDEGIDQRQTVNYPQAKSQGRLITRDHQELSASFGSDIILTIPLFHHGVFYAALVLERSSGIVFSDAEVTTIKNIVALAGEALEDKRLNDRNIFKKIGFSLKQQMIKLFGAHYLIRKSVLLVTVALITFLSIAESEQRVSADCNLEGELRRTVAAPYDGFIYNSFKRAGDRVKKDELLASMDDRDVRLERMKQLSKRNQLEKQGQDALAKRDRAQRKISSAQIEQIDAQLELINSQLERLKIKAPFDGLVVSGDLDQKLGISVSRGDPLFEITPLDAYRVILQVNEKYISSIKSGQKGTLVLSAFPEQKHEFTVNKITPVAIAEGGSNYFRVEASLAQISEQMRPGLEGIGKINIGNNKLIAIWTADLRNWWNMWVWSWTP